MQSFVVGLWPLADPAGNSFLLSIITRGRQTGYGKIGRMTGKRKLKKFRAVDAVKAMAREHIGTPPASRIVADRKKKKKEKHKASMERLLEGWE